MFATVVGPYPQATGVTARESLAQVLLDQLESGLGMVSDGQVRLVSNASRPADLEAVVDAWRLADGLIRELTNELEAGVEPPLVKACLVGPYSAGWTRHGRASAAERSGATLEAAETVHEVAQALFRAGASVVQISEDALTRVRAEDGDERALAARALHRATESLDGHLSLSVAGGNADAAGASLFFDRPFASYTFDLIHGPDNWRLITQAPRDRGIVCGVADARTRAPDVEAVMVWAARYAASSNGRGLERVGLAPSAGLELLPRNVARSKLEALSEAARKAGLPATDLAKELDPRAVDARSGALGGYDADVAARLGPRLPGRGPRREPRAKGSGG